MKTGNGSEVPLHSLLTSTLDGVELSASRTGLFSPVAIEQEARWTQLSAWTLSVANHAIRSPDRPALGVVTPPTALPWLLQEHWKSQKIADVRRVKAGLIYFVNFFGSPSSGQLNMYISVNSDKQNVFSSRNCCFSCQRPCRLCSTSTVIRNKVVWFGVSLTWDVCVVSSWVRV